MKSHSFEKPHSESVSLDSQKFNPHLEMSPLDQSLLDFAEKKYATYMGKAQEADDSQEFFSSKMQNFLDASSLSSRAALQTVATSKK